MKLKKWSPVKEILFTYLAINKILYWAYIIMGMEEISFASGGKVLLDRFLAQDLVIIACIILMFYLDWRIKEKRTKYNIVVEHVIPYSIGYVAFLGVTLVSNALRLVIFYTENITWSEYISFFVGSIIPLTIGYLVVIVALEIKLYFKNAGKKAAEESLLDQSLNESSKTRSIEDKLSMLKVLFDDGILNQEEFEDKKEKLLA